LSCSIPDPYWTAYVSALGPPLIAAIVAVIAYRQWRTANNRLKFDLFEKRLQVYQRLYDLIQEICESGNLYNHEYTRLKVATRDVKWLFGRRFNKYVYGEILPAARQLRNIRVTIENPPPEQQTSGLIKREVDLISWFVAQIDVLDKKVSADLSLRARPY